MNRRRILAALVDEREHLVGDLSDVSAADWDRPSLCGGWTVRDVVGHLLRVERMYRYAMPFLIGLVRSGFRVNAFIAEEARKRAKDRSAESLLTDLAATRYETTVGARFHYAPAIPLGEWVIHGQDIRRPLGITRSFPAERLVAVVEVLVSRNGHPWGRRQRLGERFEATDADWAWGNGNVTGAPLEEIVMRLAGRRL